jgi:hypothetical protein
MYDVLLGTDTMIGAGYSQVLADAADNARRQRSIMKNGQWALLRYRRSNHRAVLLFT